MRLFIAIDLPDEIKKELRELQKEFRSLGKMKFVNDFHLTLKFLGEVEENKLEEIKRRLKEVSFKPFDLILENLGVFPNETYISVLWVGALSEEVNDLQGEIDGKLQDLFPRENRFHSHITLARVKFIKNKEELMKKLKLEYNSSFKVEKFKLIKSILNKDGPKYTSLGEFSGL